MDTVGSFNDCNGRKTLEDADNRTPRIAIEVCEAEEEVK